MLLAISGWFIFGHAPSPPVPRPTPVPTQNPSSRVSLDHIFIIVEENKAYGDVIGSPAAPFINSLASRYALATNYSGITHPSLPNYLALTSGSTDGVTNDCNPPSAGCAVSVKNIADMVENSGRSWKEYAESMPSPCYAFNSGEYVTKHNPFVYYTDILTNQSRCTQHVVPFSQLATDLKTTATTPNFAFITPNLCNDMHDCSVAIGDNWLAKYVPMILQSPAFTTQRSLLAITWDESEGSSGRLPTILAGSAAKTNYQSAQAYDHYALLHTIETQWQLPSLTSNDAHAPTMDEFLH